MKNIVKCLLCFLWLSSPVFAETPFPPSGKKADELKILLENSRKAWETEKMKHDNSYSYKQSFVSGEGFRRVTTIKVRKGIIVERKVEEYVPGRGSSSFIEGVGEIGTKRGGGARTMEQLYDDCANDYLTQDSSENDLSLSLSEENILTGCSYRPYKCADDCTRGFYGITTFEWEGEQQGVATQE